MTTQRQIPNYEGLYSLTEDKQVYDHRRNKYSKSTGKYFAFRNSDYSKTERLSIQKLWNYLFVDKLLEHIPGKILPEYPDYIIQANGNVYSLNKSEFLKQFRQERNASGKFNCKVTLVNNKGEQQMHLVHRLVGIAFIPNPENKPQINHIDGNPENNDVSNLEWCTSKENMQHASENYLFEGTQRGVRVTRTKVVVVEEEVGEFGSLQEAADVLGKKEWAKDANKNISGVCTKNIDIPEAVEPIVNHKPYTYKGYVFRYLS